MTIDHLCMFCSDVGTRYALHRPFRIDGWVYGTNGYAIARLPYWVQYGAEYNQDHRECDYPTVAQVEQQFQDWPTSGWEALPDLKLFRGLRMRKEGDIIKSVDLGVRLYGMLYGACNLYIVSLLPELVVASGEMCLWFQFAGGGQGKLLARAEE